MVSFSIGLLANKLHMDALQCFINDEKNNVKKISYKALRTLMPYLEQHTNINFHDDDYYDVLSAAKSLLKILELVDHCRIVNGVEEKGLIQVKELVANLESKRIPIAI